MRAHTDHILAEYGSRTEEATVKIARFDQLNADYEATRHERDEAIAAIELLESKLRMFQSTIDTLEESRSADQQELLKMREQLSLFQNEYTFYREIAEKLEIKNGSSLSEATQRLRDLTEREKDLIAQNSSISEENLHLNT